jgi:hypothetical protein
VGYTHALSVLQGSTNPSPSRRGADGTDMTHKMWLLAGKSGFHAIRMISLKLRRIIKTKGVTYPSR